MAIVMVMTIFFSNVSARFFYETLSPFGFAVVTLGKNVARSLST